MFRATCSMAFKSFLAVGAMAGLYSATPLVGGGDATEGLDPNDANDVGIPLMINHQGVVHVEGSRFTGEGKFKFALVDPDSDVNVWTNDGTHVGASGVDPDTFVSRPVVDGVYSVALGDASKGMVPIPSDAFNDHNLKLRVWFQSPGHLQATLEPDLELTSVPYAYRAAVATHAIDGVPPGTIVPFGGPNVPDGWLACDGVSKLISEYPSLHAAIGTVWGEGDDPGNTFCLPDLRGRFPRGVDVDSPDPNHWRDPNQDTRVVCSPGGNTGNAVGSCQEDAFQGHKHGLNHSDVTAWSWSEPGPPQSQCWPDIHWSENWMFNNLRVVQPTNLAECGQVRYARETRPVNVYVNYIIKY